MFCQAEDGIRDLVRSRGLGDVYKRQGEGPLCGWVDDPILVDTEAVVVGFLGAEVAALGACLLYTSDAADERSSVDLGGRRIIKKKKISICDEAAPLQHK